MVCHKYHGHCHYKNECPIIRAFTIQEWRYIQAIEKPKAMLVSINGREEEMWPNTREEDDDGSYRVNENGVLTKYETNYEESEEELREQLHPENELNTFILRRNFHTTSKERKLDQRESIFQTKCRVKGKICDLIIDGGSETNCVSQNMIKELKNTYTSTSTSL